MHARAGGRSGPPVVGAPLSLMALALVVVAVPVLVSPVMTGSPGSPVLAVASPASGVHPITSAAATRPDSPGRETDGLAEVAGRLRMVTNIARARC